MAGPFNVLRVFLAKPEAPGQRLLRIAVFAILISTAVLVALIAANRARLTDTACATLIDHRADTARSDFVGFLEPLVIRLDVIRTLRQKGNPGFSTTKALHENVPAVIEPLERVHSITVVTPDDQDVTMLRAEKWQTRPSSDFNLESKKTSWYCEAGAAEDDRVRFTDSDTKIGTESIAITAAVAMPSEKKEQAPCVIALNIAREQVGQFLRDLDIGQQGTVLILSDLDRVTRVSLAIDGYVEATSREEFFARAKEAAGAGLHDPLRQLTSDAARPPPFRFALDGAPWWCAISSFSAAGRPVRVGLALPEDDLLANFERTEHLLIYVLLGLLAVGILSVIFLAHSYSQQLRDIAARPKYSAASAEDIQELIGKGEQDRLEFKSTMRWNLKADKAGKEISFAWLKTVAAFMNTDGGTLLIGVEDDGNILGIEADNFPNEDKYLLHFNNLIKEHIGLQHAASISFDLRPVGEKKILVVDCEKTAEAVFLKQGDEEAFFVRVGPGTRKLPTSKVLEYLKTR